MTLSANVLKLYTALDNIDLRGNLVNTLCVIRNSEQLTGFTEHEIELIAVVARYHRKSRPSEKHPEFAALDDDDQQLVRQLAGMLRVAIGLDRRHSGVVQTMRVNVDDGRMRIEPIAGRDDDLDLEVYAARERSHLLAIGLGVDVEIVASAGANPNLESS